MASCFAAIAAAAAVPVGFPAPARTTQWGFLELWNWMVVLSWRAPLCLLKICQLAAIYSPNLWIRCLASDFCQNYSTRSSWQNLSCPASLQSASGSASTRSRCSKLWLLRREQCHKWWKLAKFQSKSCRPPLVRPEEFDSKPWLKSRFGPRAWVQNHSYCILPHD